MKNQFLLGGLLGAIGLLLAPVVRACPACGDKLGVPFARIHSGHQADRIIFFARRDSELRSFNKRAGLSRRMERSGHTVRIIDNDEDLDGALRANQTDLVLAEPADAIALRTRFTGDSSAPLVLSLVAVATAAADANPELPRCQLQAAVDQSESVLHTIERFISGRRAGEVIDCAAADGQG